MRRGWRVVPHPDNCGRHCFRFESVSGLRGPFAPDAVLCDMECPGISRLSGAYRVQRLGSQCDLKPLVPEHKVIEYLLEAQDKKKRLIDRTCRGFAQETASESLAPGGGSIAA